MNPERLRALLTTVLVAGTAWAAHTTAQSAPGSWRWRVVIPLAEPLERPAYVALVDLLRRTLLTETDAPLTLEGDAGANRDAARLWYGPARLPERPDDYATCHADGMPMDGNAVLDGCAHYTKLTRDALATRLENDCDAKRKELTDAWQAAKEAAEKAANAKAKAAAELDKLRVGTFAGEAFAQFERRRDGLDRPVPLPPGWTRTATELRGGLWAGCYFLVGGTGAGKSQWAFEVAYHAATRAEPVPVLYVGLELDRAGVVARLAALGMHGRAARADGSRLPVPWSGLYLGEREPLAAMDGKAGIEVRALLDSSPFYLMSGEARGGWSYADLRPAVDGLRARHPEGPALVIVDFLQLVGSPPDDREELRERIGNAAYEARMVARACGVSVLLLSATARSNYALFTGEGKVEGGNVQALGTGDPARFLGTGKESGEVEFAADGVIALCRGSWKAPDPLTPNPAPPPLWLAVAKIRTGRAPGANGWSCYTFDGTSFAECDSTPPRARDEAKGTPPKQKPDLS